MADLTRLMEDVVASLHATVNEPVIGSPSV